MRKWITALSLLTALMIALTGCGGGGGGGGGGGTDPTPTGNTIVKGTVVDNQTTPKPVANVKVTLGSLTTRTDSKGMFSFNLGSNVPVSSLFATSYDANFKISTSLLDPNLYPQVSVFYRGVGYMQLADYGGATIPLPFEVYTASGVTSDLGTVTIQYNDPLMPPPEPY